MIIELNSYSFNQQRMKVSFLLEDSFKYCVFRQLAFRVLIFENQAGTSWPIFYRSAQHLLGNTDTSQRISYVYEYVVTS